jgi:hypothetical protein
MNLNWSKGELNMKKSVMLFTIIIFLLTGCTMSEQYYHGYKIVKKINESELLQAGEHTVKDTDMALLGQHRDDKNVVIDKNLKVLPFIDHRTEKNIDVAFPEPLAKLLSELLAEKAKKANIFKTIQILPENLYNNKNTFFIEKTIAETSGKNTSVLLTWGNIYDFSNKLEMKEYHPISLFSMEKSKYNVTFTIKGNIKFSMDDGKNISGIKIDKNKTYSLEMYELYHSNMNNIITDETSLKRLNQSDFDKIAHEFLSDVIDDAINEIKENFNKINQRNIDTDLLRADYFYYPPNTRVISIEKVNELNNVNGMIVGLGSGIGAASGALIMIGPYLGKSDPTLGEGGFGLIIPGALIGGCVGLLAGVISSTIIMDKQVESNLIYAKQGKGRYDVVVMNKIYEW